MNLKILIAILPMPGPKVYSSCVLSPKETATEVSSLSLLWGMSFVLAFVAVRMTMLFMMMMKMIMNLMMIATV